jgi:hypothetical protein
MGWKPEEYDWERWESFGNYVVRMSKRRLNSLEVDFVASAVRLVNTTVAYTYMYPDWREFLAEGDSTEIEEDWFSPNFPWLARCRMMDWDPRPWTWATHDYFDHKYFWHEIVEHGSCVYLQRLTSQNSLLRLAIDDGKRCICFGFETTNQNAVQVQEALQVARVSRSREQIIRAPDPFDWDIFEMHDYPESFTCTDSSTTFGPGTSR